MVIPTEHTFCDILQSLLGDAEKNMHGLGFQDHNLKGTILTNSHTKMGKGKMKPAFQ